MLAAAMVWGVWFTTHAGNDSQSEIPPTTGVATNESTAKIPTESNVLVAQEASGDIRFTNTLASLAGHVELQSSGSEQVLAGWTSEEDVAKWRFEVVKLPPRGAFRFRIKYRVNDLSAASKYVMELDKQMRARDLQSAANVFTEEFYVAVQKSGIHELAIRVTGKPRDLVIHSIELLVARPSTE